MADLPHDPEPTATKDPYLADAAKLVGIIAIVILVLIVIGVALVRLI